jgi:hypothetical protein
VKLRELALAGFGRLARTHFTFGDGLTVVYGPNEAGKSTIAAAIVASLYGLPRGTRESWRPWSGDPYASRLVYELADGRTFEVHREYHKEKGVRVFDEDGNDVTSELVNGRTVAPGEAHLHISLDAFVNAACVRQQSVAIDGDRSGAIATALTRALDGGPKDDAALGALERLAAARRLHVGTARATVNAPLRGLTRQLDEREAAAAQLRESRDRLAAVRERRATARSERARIDDRLRATDRDLKALRAAELDGRLHDLREYRDELAARHAERTRYDDVATFPAERIVEFERAYLAWEAADTAAQNADDDAAAARAIPEEAAEMAALAAGPGSLSEVEFATLREAAFLAESARGRATAAANEAAAARRDGTGGRTIAGTALAVAAVAVALTVGFAIAHWWAVTETILPIAVIACALVAVRARNRMRRARIAERKQQAADEALATERTAAAAVAGVLGRLGLASVEELGRKRERLAELRRKAELTLRTAARAQTMREEERRLAAIFDELAAEVVPDVLASRPMRRQVAHDRAARRRQRDGIDNAIAMLELRRGEILRGADEFTLLAEREALAAAGIVPADAYVAGRADELAALVHELQRAAHATDITIAELSKELEIGEAGAGDLASLEEEIVTLREEAERLASFDRALVLAYATVERITRETHRAFARRLEGYAADALSAVTAGRYGELHVDPKSLAVRVRVPETKSIENLDQLSAGTRDQIYLVVRFAMARMFAEGLETPPLLLDDPFAYWDEARIERCLPLVAQNAFAAQTILFTSSAELAAAAVTIGATRIDLAPATAVATS